jgi:predicted ribosome quality control (RQC) complex YloA/Tae2 family protein
MAFDGIVTKSVIAELNSCLLGTKVNKVLEPTKNEVILELYGNGNNYSLILSCDPDFCRINLTKNSKPNPQNAYNFCMLLRKYLVGGKISSISNYDLERTVQIKFDCYNEMNDLVTRKLYIEIMSRQSNIVLTNENNIIIDSLKHFDNNVRELLPAHEYTFVPINKASFLELKSSEEFINIITNSKEKTLSTAIQNLFIGFSKNFIKNILQKLNIEDNFKDNIKSNIESTTNNIEDTTNNTIENTTNNVEFSKKLELLYSEISNILADIGTDKISCINYKNDFTIDNFNATTPLQINYFLDDYYFNKEKLNIFQSSRNSLLHIVLSSLKKVNKKLENINQKLKECNEMDTYKLYGELLTANLYRLKANYNLDKIEIENYYSNNELITIPLDKSISVHKNIDKFFKKYNKLKNALEIVSVQKKEAEKELDYIESIVFSLENAKTMKDINEVYQEISENIATKKVINNKKQQKVKNTKSKDNSKEIEQDLTSIEFNGYQIFIGKNNIQNEYLTLKFAEKNDLWFHTQKIHGSHIILKTNNEEDIPTEVIEKCASLAKENSKASLDTGASVDYCPVRYVKKAPGSKPGMVIYTNYKTIYIKD